MQGKIKEEILMEMKEVDKLMEQIRKTQEELDLAHKEYDIADRDMLDSVAYKIKSLTCKYEALSRRLKNQVFPKITEKHIDTPAQRIMIFLGIK